MAICEEIITAEDHEPPSVSCPADIHTMADAGKTYATVTLTPPFISDNCTSIANLTIIWNMSAPTSGSGLGIINSPFQFNTGTTIVEYTVTDNCGNSQSCSFNVVVQPNDPPVLLCASNIAAGTDPGLCTASLNPGQPTLVSGTEPITWAWSMSGASTASGTGSSVSPIPYPFNIGITTITWTATNISGTSQCSQLITVTDNQPPVFTPPNPFIFCVENIITADYDDPTMDITPDRPEYYIFQAGSNQLNLDPGTFSDNCGLACGVEIRWRINLADGTAIPALPALFTTGQPSAYGTDIQLPGDISADVVHSITYQIVDCNGNVSNSQSVSITINPRPNVIKQ
jgi:hypothetical protein